MLLLSNLICIHIIHPGGTPIRGKSAELTFTEWSYSFFLSSHHCHLCLVFRIIPIMSINFIWFSLYCSVTIGDSHIVNFPFLFLFLFVLFISFFMKMIISVVICFKESISRSWDHRPVTAYHLSLFFSFSSSFFLLFSFFSSFFSFFFFCPTGEKKKIIFFFLSCSCSGPKSRWSAEQCQTCRRQPGTPAFCLYLSKGFCFCSSILFSLTVLKVKEWLPFPPAPTRLQPDSNAFVPTSFFLGLLASGFLDLLFFRLWKPKVLSILGGMLCCWFFILWLGVRFLYNSCFAFFLGFCDTTLLIPLVDFDGCLRGSVWRPSSHGWLARPRSHRPCFLTFYKPSNSTALCFSANVINDCKLWQTVFLFLKICMS